MTKIDQTIISHLEKLSRLKLAEHEKQQITQDLQSIVDMFDKLQEVNTDGVEPLHHVGHSTSALRKDEIRNELSQDEALQNVPSRKGGFIAVPKFLKPE